MAAYTTRNVVEESADVCYYHLLSLFSVTTRRRANHTRKLLIWRILEWQNIRCNVLCRWALMAVTLICGYCLRTMIASSRLKINELYLFGVHWHGFIIDAHCCTGAKRD